MSARQRQTLTPVSRAVEATRHGTQRQPAVRRDLDGPLLRLQRSHGNHFVQRLVARSAPGPAGPGPAPRPVRPPQATKTAAGFSSVLAARAAATAPDLLVRRPGPGLGRLAAGEQTAPAAPLVVGATHDPAEAAADRVADTVAEGWSAGSAPELAASAGGPRIHRRATASDPGGPLDGATSAAVGAARRAGGVPLGAAARSHMETALGTGLSGVRVHAGASARDLCDTVGAHAFTLGQHVFFRRGLPDLGSAGGRHLLAHELAHVTQQPSATVVRRSYLDGDHDWIPATTRRRRITGWIKGRPEPLRQVDDAVAAVREAYDSGSLSDLYRTLTALRKRIAEWKRTRPEGSNRMLDQEVAKLGDQARDLAWQTGYWQGDAFRQKLTEHQTQLSNVRDWLTEGSRRTADLRLRNSVEWIRRGKAKLFALTPAGDNAYRTKVLLRKQGRKPTAQDISFFPNPDSGRGAVGDGLAESHIYNPANAADRMNVTVNKPVNGWSLPGYIAVTDLGTSDRDTFFQTLRHEVQHDADKHRGPELSEGVTAAGAPDGPEFVGTRGELEFQKALQTYKTEYRTHSYQGGLPGDTPAGIRTPARGHDWDSRQLAIFDHLRTDYAPIGTAVGGDRPTLAQQRFIHEAHIYRNPDTEGFNKYNSPAIDDLYLAVRAVPAHTEQVTNPAVLAVLKAARALSVSDVAYLRAKGAREEAFMLRSMIFDRLDGAALEAFRATLK